MSGFQLNNWCVNVLLLVDRLDFLITGEMKACLDSLFALLPYRILFTNLRFYPELVILVFFLLTGDYLCFNNLGIQCNC